MALITTNFICGADATVVDDPGLRKSGPSGDPSLKRPGQIQSSLRDWKFVPRRSRPWKGRARLNRRSATGNLSRDVPGLEMGGLSSIVAPRLEIYFVSLSRP